jgi:DNA-binding transcriptional MocR family regulator
MEIRPELDANSSTPIYRQLSSYLTRLIETGDLLPGDRLPPTRELAGQLGLNRTTVSAAYDALEQNGLIKGSVGRGSFVCGAAERETDALDWSHAPSLRRFPYQPVPRVHVAVNFSASRPSERLFPVDEFRASCDEVLASDKMRSLLQVGSPSGLRTAAPLPDAAFRIRGPFRRHHSYQRLPTGCRSAAASTCEAGYARVAIEEPVYPGLRNLFLEAGADLIGVAVGQDGVDFPLVAAGTSRRARRSVVLTPSFQNPTGATIPAANRRGILDMARAAGAVVIENDIYSELAYQGAGSTEAEIARFQRDSAGEFFEDCVSRHALRVDHCAAPGD